MKNFTGRVAFVTGGASGIGFGMARAFLAEGMKVVVADYSRDNLDKARSTLSGNNLTHFVQVDVSDRAALRAAAEEAVATFGTIHVLCNNAGVTGGGDASDPDFEEWDRAVGINLGGVVNGCKIIVPIIKAQGQGGHVVNTSSMAGMVPLPGFGAYAAAKYAVRGLTECLRMALAPEGIGVSCLFPGAVRSGMLHPPEDHDGPADADEFGEMTALLWEAARVAMDPLTVGRRVVQAIRANEPHILTHAEFADEVAERNRAIEAAFPMGDVVPDARTRFEQSRRAAVDRLFSLPAKD